MKIFSASILSLLLVFSGNATAAGHEEGAVQSGSHGQGTIQTGEHQEGTIQAGEHQEGNIESGEHGQGNIQSGNQENSAQQDSSAAANNEASSPSAQQVQLAEQRAIQAIHLSNLTEFAAQLIGVAKHTDQTSKDLAQNHVKKYAQWEVDLVKLAAKEKIPLISDQDDIIAIKSKNKELLKQLSDAPKDENFQTTFNQLIWAEQGALGEFLDKESKVGFSNPEVTNYVNEIVANLQKPE